MFVCEGGGGGGGEAGISAYLGHDSFMCMTWSHLYERQGTHLHIWKIGQPSAGRATFASAIASFEKLFIDRDTFASATVSSQTNRFPQNPLHFFHWLGCIRKCTSLIWNTQISLKSFSIFPLIGMHSQVPRVSSVHESHLKQDRFP